MMRSHDEQDQVPRPATPADPDSTFGMADPPRAGHGTPGYQAWPNQPTFGHGAPRAAHNARARGISAGPASPWAGPAVFAPASPCCWEVVGDSVRHACAMEISAGRLHRPGRMLAVAERKHPQEYLRVAPFSFGFTSTR